MCLVQRRAGSSVRPFREKAPKPHTCSCHASALCRRAGPAWGTESQQGQGHLPQQSQKLEELSLAPGSQLLPPRGASPRNIEGFEANGEAGSISAPPAASREPESEASHHS